MTTQTGIRSCEVSGRPPAVEKILAWVPTLIASAALFSLFFAGDASLAWLGVLGFVPLGLRLTRCPTCGGARQAPTANSWPGH